jgi:hypothetical protein
MIKITVEGVDGVGQPTRNEWRVSLTATSTRSQVSRTSR